MSRSKVIAFVGKAGFRYYVDDNTMELQYGKQNLDSKHRKKLVMKYKIRIMISFCVKK